MRVVISAGPTREAIDPVRFITNRSTGKMGYALAAAAVARGLETVLVSGPVALPRPAGLFRFDSVETAVPKLQAAIKSGAALNKLREMIERLGGDTSYIDEPDKLVNTRRIVPVLAPRSGYIGAMNAKQIGLASLLIGAGREHVSDTVDPAVGILMHKRYGDKVSCGEAFASMYVNDERNLAQALDMLVSAVEISLSQPPEMKLIYKTIE